MVVSILAVIFLVLGLVLYMSGSAKWGEVGRILLFTGALGLVLIAGSATIRIL